MQCARCLSPTHDGTIFFSLTYCFRGDLHESSKNCDYWHDSFVCVRQFRIFQDVSTSRAIRYRWQINDHSVFFQHDSFVGILLITKSLTVLYLVVLSFIFVFCYDYVKSKNLNPLISQ